MAADNTASTNGSTSSTSNTNGSTSSTSNTNGTTTPQDRLPITLLTGFVGSGKTTLLLNLLPQLRAAHPGYKLSLIKNEIGDLAIDSALAAAAEMAATRELLGDCICCTNVGQIGVALDELCNSPGGRPDRVVIETSGSAEPIKLMVEINRLAAETGRYALDGVISVVDVENWGGYASTSFTAKLQARQTDLIVLNKWEEAGEERLERVLDRLGDMDVETPVVRSDRGWLNVELVFGVDRKMVLGWEDAGEHVHDESCGHGHGEGGDGVDGHSHKKQKQEHKHDHNEEMECLSIALNSSSPDAAVDLKKLESLLKSAPKDEVYRIKAVMSTKGPLPQPSTSPSNPSNRANDVAVDVSTPSRHILNWSFGRWAWIKDSRPRGKDDPVLRMSVFTARYESTKWLKRIESGQYVALDGEVEGELSVKKVL